MSEIFVQDRIILIDMFFFIQIINLLPIPSTFYTFLQYKKQSNTNTNGITNNAYEHSNESSIIRSPIVLDLSSSDDEIKNVRILWLRNITRVRMQVKNNFLVD
jgi:hypothetical protein